MGSMNDKKLNKQIKDLLGGFLVMMVDDDQKLGKTNAVMDGEEIKYISPSEKFDALVELLGLGLVVFYTDDEDSGIGIRTVDPAEAEPTDKFEFLKGKYDSIKLEIEARKNKEDK